MKDWSDAKRLIFEDILFCLILLIGIVFFDYLVNWAYSVHILQASPLTTHPYKFGSGQCAAAVLATLQLVRRINEWRYYA